MNASHLLSAFILMIFTSAAQGSTLFDLFFGNPYKGSGYSRGRRGRGRPYPSDGGYNEYKRICKVVNPNPYDFIGSNPYPGAPFCPP